MQKYGYSPASSNVCSNDSPVAMNALSNTEPVSSSEMWPLVTVWSGVAASSFSHIIVVPLATVIVIGS